MLFKNKYKENWELMKHYLEVMIEFNRSHEEKLAGEDNSNNAIAKGMYILNRLTLSDVLHKMKKLEKGS